VQGLLELADDAAVVSRERMQLLVPAVHCSIAALSHWHTGRPLCTATAPSIDPSKKMPVVLSCL